ncbi:hypothetical protein Tco_0509522 [Tanacetum coccineum]
MILVVTYQTILFDLNDNAVSGNGNNDVLLLKGGDGFVDSVGGDNNHKCNQDKQDQQDKQPSLVDAHELRALRKEVALVKVDDARIAKLERFMNDNFIPCNDRSKGNHNALNPGLTIHWFSTCSRHVVDNPEVACAGTGIHNPDRNNDSQNSNHNVVYKGLSCSANDHMSSCFSLEMPNDEVVFAGTAIHNADEMYDSPNCVTDNDVNERIGVSSNYSMLNTSYPEMHNANVLVVGMGIDKADENIYNPNANDNDVNQGIVVSFNARMSNSSGHDMPNDVVVVACMGIDKPDGHNDNPNANDNDVNQEIDPMSTCSGPDMHLAEVVVAGMEIDKGDVHIDIPTASDNDVNLAKSVSVNDPMENEFVDDFMDVLNDEENIPKVSLDDMNVDEQEEKLIDTVKAQSNKSDYVNVVTDDLQTLLSYLRSAKERKKRLAMALESPFGQQPPTTPVPTKSISRSVNCDFILPPNFEEDVSGQPKMRSINELMIMEVFVEVYFSVNEPKRHWKVWTGKQLALASTQGRPIESFAQLPFYCYNLKWENEGTVTDDEGRFKICFIGFGVVIKSFLCYMRPLIIIDVTRLKGTYLGTNLVVVGMDRNNQIILIATVARVEGLTSVNQLAKPWFLNKTLKGTYAGLFFPVTDVSTWEIPNEIQQVLPPDMGKKQSARPKNRDRIRSQGEGPIIKMWTVWSVKDTTETSS